MHAESQSANVYANQSSHEVFWNRSFVCDSFISSYDEDYCILYDRNPSELSFQLITTPTE